MQWRTQGVGSITQVLKVGKKRWGVGLQIDAEVLLTEQLGWERSALLTQGDTVLPWGTVVRHAAAMTLRQWGWPMGYVRGWAAWRGRRITLTPAVLCPRDETEMLVEHIAEQWAGRTPQRVLDIGTGSGVLALWAAEQWPHATVMGVDWSAAALRVAAHNARGRKLNVDWRRSDLLTAVPRDPDWDVIIANLPYVPTTLPQSPTVAREPAEAIFSGEDGLGHLRRLAEQLRSGQWRWGEMWLEFLPQQWPLIKHIYGEWAVTPFCDAGEEIFFARVRAS